MNADVLTTKATDGILSSPSFVVDYTALANLNGVTSIPPKDQIPPNKQPFL